MLDSNFSGTNLIVVETFDYNSHLFYLVKENNHYYLRFENDDRLINNLVIKPDIWVKYKEGGYEHGVVLLKPYLKNVDKVLAMDFTIDPEIFEILIDNGLISYSKAMADLYDLPVKNSRDYRYHTRDYKNKKNKLLVLDKMKHGIFN